MKKGILCKNKDEIIESILDSDLEKVTIVELSNVIEVMKESILAYIELGYLNEIKSDIIFLRNVNKNTFSGCNYIANLSDIEEGSIAQLTYSVLGDLKELGLLLILEPNNNLYIDIDYSYLSNILSDDKDILDLLIDMQKCSFVNYDSTLNKKRFNELYSKVTDLMKLEDSGTYRFSYLYNIALYFKKICVVLKDI